MLNIARTDPRLTKWFWNALTLVTLIALFAFYTIAILPHKVSSGQSQGYSLPTTDQGTNFD